jgi:hypothetical protein
MKFSFKTDARIPPQNSRKPVVIKPQTITPHLGISGINGIASILDNTPQARGQNSARKDNNIPLKPSNKAMFPKKKSFVGGDPTNIASDRYGEQTDRSQDNTS